MWCGQLFQEELYIVTIFTLKSNLTHKSRNPLEPPQYCQYSLAPYLNVTYIVAGISTPNFALVWCHLPLYCKNLLTILFLSLSGLTSDKPLKKSITNLFPKWTVSNKCLPSLLCYCLGRFVNFKVLYTYISVLTKYGKIMSQKQLFLSLYINLSYLLDMHIWHVYMHVYIQCTV